MYYLFRILLINNELNVWNTSFAIYLEEISYIYNNIINK